jgi:hypothetical protein
MTENTNDYLNQQDAEAIAPSKEDQAENGHAKDGMEAESDAADDRKAVEPDSDLTVLDMGDDEDDIPPRQWILGTTFCGKFLSGLTGAGSAGKTAVRYLQYLSIATGQSFTGEYVHKRCRVLVVCLEDDQDEVRRRLRAARLHYHIDKVALKGWLYVWTPRGVKLMVKDAKHGVVPGKMEGQLCALIKKHEIDLTGIDPFIKTHTVGENDNAAIDLVASRLAEIAHELGCAVDYIHHQRKGIGAAGDADSGRGASALRDASRLVYTLTPMTSEEAAAYNLSEEKRRSLVRLDSAKVNLVRATSDATWFELIGVELGNRTDAYPNGDEVQTVQRWYPPDLFADFNTSIINTILDEIDHGTPDGGRYSDNNRATKRAAWKIVTKHASNKSEAQARAIINTWAKNGILFLEEYYDEESRKQAQGLRVNPAKRPGRAAHSD